MSHPSRAARDGWLIARADSAYLTVNVGLAYLRDRRVMAVLRGWSDRAATLRDQIRSRENLGQFLPGSADEIDAVIQDMNQNALSLDLVLRSERSALAQAAGFLNPDAITDLTEGDSQARPESAPSVADGGSDAEYERQALESSLELRQLDALVDASHSDAQARAWNWMDPSGDYRGGLGLGIVDFVAIGGSQEEEMRVQRERITADALRHARSASQALENSDQAITLATSALALHTRRVNRMQSNLQLGLSFELSELTLALRDVVQAQVTLETSRCARAQAVAWINRILLAGPFAAIRLGNGLAPH
jgi:hypothetical protein